MTARRSRREPGRTGSGGRAGRESPSNTTGAGPGLVELGVDRPNALQPADVVRLQRSVGNDSVIRLLSGPGTGGHRSGGRNLPVQRVYEPASLTADSELHKHTTTTDRAGKTTTTVKTGWFSTKGRKLPARTVVVANDADSSGNWVGAMDVRPEAWIPATHKASAAKGYLENDKLTKVTYPQSRSIEGLAFGPWQVYWHEDFGEFAKDEISPDRDDVWLVMELTGMTWKKYDSTARAPLTAAYTELETKIVTPSQSNPKRVGVSPVDGAPLFSQKVGDAYQYTRYNRATRRAGPGHGQ